jgi:hypothetical protein
MIYLIGLIPQQDPLTHPLHFLSLCFNAQLAVQIMSILYQGNASASKPENPLRKGGRGFSKSWPVQLLVHIQVQKESLIHR